MGRGYAGAMNFVFASFFTCFRRTVISFYRALVFVNVAGWFGTIINRFGRDEDRDNLYNRKLLLVLRTSSKEVYCF